MNILATGGLGSFGSAVIRRLTRTTGHVVVGLDQETYAASHDALEEARGHPRHVHTRADICESALGWTARHDFESGLEATLRWPLDHESWWGPIRARRYAGQRLGEGGVG